MSESGRVSGRPDLTRPILLGAMLWLAILVGCTTLPVVPFPPGVTPPRSVAVLPLDNQTNSVGGAIKIREMLSRNLDRKGYVALPLSKVDQILSDQFGISLGGQITEEFLPEIGKALEVDAVITGTVMAYGRLGPKELEAKVALYESGTGSKLWDHYGWGHTEVQTHVDQNGVSHVVVTQNSFDEFFGNLFARMPNGQNPPAEARWGY